ncbi:U3 snoRNP protein [Ophidiomyces ophidiicola]|nr:U3 snoRNP protein [Ophidiomyces ophidiicola]
MESPSAAQQTGLDAASIVPITKTLLSNPEEFLTPSALLYNQSSVALKHYLDALASSTTELQQSEQLRQRRNKRKRVENELVSGSNKLQLHEVHTTGFDVRQIWEQVQRVLKVSSDVTRHNTLIQAQKFRNGVNNAAGKNNLISESSEDPLSDQEAESEEEVLQKSNEDEILEDTLGLSDEDQGDNSHRLSLVDSSEPRLSKQDRPSQTKRLAPFIQDRHGLNDGFFSIDDFNKQSRLFEELDTKRATLDDIPSDEEEIDWQANPFIMAGYDQDDNDDEESMGDVDTDRMENEDISGESDIGGLEDLTRNATYEEFFDPPDPKRLQKNDDESLRKDGLQPFRPDIEADVQRAIADVHRDLFDDEDSEDYEGSASKTAGAKESTHEKSRAKITDEIRRLEAANVANKEWTLTGEAKGADRPINSLIEEDLDFERVGKPVPVITAEITDEIEALIKRRIVAKEFDDITRRPPPGLADYAEARSKFILDETKPQQSLAELYEVDHLKATDQNYISKKDAKIQKEQNEIKQLWNDVCSQLDTLSNLHFRPKQPSTNIQVVPDVDTIVMEDARPSVGDGLANSGTLAPQEVYVPDARNRDEFVTKGGAAVSRDEMSREEKLRRRRREKQQKRKRTADAVKQPESAAAKKQQLVTTLGKGGVKVIGKDGALTDVRGQKISTSNTSTSRQTFKL